MRTAIARTLVAGGLLGALVPAAQASTPEVRSAMRMARAPVAQLERSSAERSHGVTFHRFRQVVNGVPVLGSEAVVTDAAGQGDLLTDRTHALAAPAPARISRDRGLFIAREGAGVRSLRAKAKTELAILAGRAGPRLVWRVLLPSAVPLASLEVLVDVARAGSCARATCSSASTARRRSSIPIPS